VSGDHQCRPIASPQGDPFITAEQRLGFEQEMRAAGVDCWLYLYGGASQTGLTFGRSH